MKWNLYNKMEYSTDLYITCLNQDLFLKLIDKNTYNLL